MKTYNEFITELNKFEKMVIQKGLKTLQQAKPTKSLVKGLKGAMIKLRNNPTAANISPRRKIENMFRTQGSNVNISDKTAELASKGMTPKNILDTQTRHKAMRGLTKKKSAELDKLGMQVPLYKGRRAKGMGDANRRLNLPANNNMKKMKEPFTNQSIYNTNKMGQLSTKGVDYIKDVPDSLLNKLRSAMKRKKKGK